MIIARVRAVPALLMMAAAAAPVPAAVTSLNVNLQTQAVHVIPPAAGETAGAAPAGFWNNTDAGGLTSALLSDGTSRAISVAFSPGLVSHSQITTPGDNDDRLMGGSFDLHGGSVTVNVSGLTSEFTAAGYDVYLYLWGNDNPNQQGLYQVDFLSSGAVVDQAFFHQTIQNFTGFDHSGQSSTAAGAGAANYIRFADVGNDEDQFAVEITNIGGVNPEAWVVINGIQVVAVPEPTSPPCVTLSSLAWGFAVGRRRR